MKIWAAMKDEHAVYVLLGGEAQSRVHYAMPVRDMLYDAINYAAQVDEVAKSHRNNKESVCAAGSPAEIGLPYVILRAAS